MTAFAWQYTLAWLCTFINIICGAIIAASAGGAQLGLSQISIVWMGVAVAVSTALGVLLPAVRTTPAKRAEEKSLMADGAFLRGTGDGSAGGVP